MTAPESASTSQALGICLRPEYDEHALGKLAAYAQAAEKKGFHSVWLAESWGMDATVLLGHIGAHTKSIRLGTAILNVYSRTPGLMAMAAESLNELYPGRFILGLGASTKAVIEGFHGIPFSKPAARMREVAQIVRKATAGEQVDFKGKTVSLQGYRLRVPPRCPPPPIYMAALGDVSMKVVAEVADGWIPYLTPLRGLAAKAAELRAGARAAGRPENAVSIAPLVETAVSHDREQARNVVRRHIAMYLGAMGPHYRGFVASFGFEKEVETIQATWEAKQRDAARAAVTEEMIDQMSVSGTPAECREQLARLREAGVDLPILFFPGECTNEMVELAIDTLTADTLIADPSTADKLTETPTDNNAKANA